MILASETKDGKTTYSFKLTEEQYEALLKGEPIVKITGCAKYERITFKLTCKTKLRTPDSPT